MPRQVVVDVVVVVVPVVVVEVDLVVVTVPVVADPVVMVMDEATMETICLNVPTVRDLVLACLTLTWLEPKVVILVDTLLLLVVVDSLVLLVVDFAVFLVSLILLLYALLVVVLKAVGSLQCSLSLWPKIIIIIKAMNIIMISTPMILHITWAKNRISIMRNNLLRNSIIKVVTTMLKINNNSIRINTTRMKDSMKMPENNRNLSRRKILISFRILDTDRRASKQTTHGFYGSIDYG